MAALLTARQICEAALRKARAYTVNDAGADEQHLRIALDSLDMILSHKAGTHFIFHLLTEPLTVDLVSGQAVYSLPDEIGASWPVDDASFISSASLSDQAGNLTPLEIIRVDEVDGLADRLDRTGRPQKVYIDRLAEPKMRTFPVIADDEHSIEIRLQKLTPSVSSSDPTSGNKGVSLRPSWQLWAVQELAHYLGDGPITNLQANEVQRLREESDRLWRELMAFDNRAHDSAPHITSAWDPY